MKGSSNFRAGPKKIIGRKEIGLEYPECQYMEDFFALFAHEIRTPLSGILETCNYIKEKTGRDTEGFDFHLNAMTGMARNSLDTLDNMINTVKNTTGRLNITIEKQEFYFLPFVQALVQQFKIYEILQEKTLRVINYGITEISLKTDPVKLGQVLKNLISNAFKFSRSGTTITVTCSRNHNGILIAISNKGPGIPVDKLHLLFQPFQAIDAGYAGTGLGLYLSKIYVESIGGTISVKSSKNAETVFTIDIPGCLSEQVC